MADFTVTNYLLPSIKRRAMLPATNPNLSDTDIIALCNEELQTTIVPSLTGVNEEYFVTYFDQPVILGQSEYPIPAQAAANTVRNVELVDGQGNRFPLTRLSPDQLLAYSSNSFGGLGSQTGFFLRDQVICLYPVPTNNFGGYVLRLSYSRRPNDLVPNASAGQVQSVNTSTGVITFSGTLPATFTTTSSLDCINGLTPFAARWSGVTPTAVTSNTITVPTTTVNLSQMVALDWVSLFTESPIPQMTREAHPILAQMVAVKCLESLGDRAGMQAALAMFGTLMAQLTDTLTPRVAGAPEIIVNSNGPFRRMSNSWRRRNW